MRRGNIVLTGFMGTGKTTVGRIVAERLGLTFVDTDAVIEDRHGPIPAIFTDRGEPGFREIEREVAAELAAGDGRVIATGGRMLLDPHNADALGETGTVICLVATADELADRLLADGTPNERPLLAVDDPRQRIVDLLAERADGYAQFPQVTTTDRTPDEVAEAVIEMTTRKDG